MPIYILKIIITDWGGKGVTNIYVNYIRFADGYCWMYLCTLAIKARSAL